MGLWVYCITVSLSPVCYSLCLRVSTGPEPAFDCALPRMVPMI
jgi:hypothetical protein